MMTFDKYSYDVETVGIDFGNMDFQYGVLTVANSTPATYTISYIPSRIPTLQEEVYDLCSIEYIPASKEEDIELCQYP